MRGGGRFALDEKKDALQFKNKLECKNCAFFCRVNEVGAKTHLRGFCMRGMNEGDYDLYLGSSYSTECPSFTFSSAANKITEFENHLNEIKWKYMEDDEKQAKRMINYEKRRGRWKNHPMGFFAEIFLGDEIGWEKFKKDYFDSMVALSKMAQIDERDYNVLLKFINTSVIAWVNKKRLEILEKR
jgi:hypothetical protein